MTIRKLENMKEIRKYLKKKIKRKQNKTRKDDTKEERGLLRMGNPSPPDIFPTHDIFLFWIFET